MTALANCREIYLIRHGATALNSESGGVDRIRGWRNVPLSDKGREEVAELAEKLKNSGIKIVVSSDLDRAKETAEAVAGKCGAEIKLTKKLRPWDLGEYTGQESTSVHPLMLKFAAEKPWKKIPGGESFDEFRYRVFSGLREFMFYAPAELMAVVTHHRDERLINSWIAKGSPASCDIDMNVMFRRGETTAHSEKVKIDLDTLYGMVDRR